MAPLDAGVLALHVVAAAEARQQAVDAWDDTGSEVQVVPVEQLQHAVQRVLGAVHEAFEAIEGRLSTVEVAVGDAVTATSAALTRANEATAEASRLAVNGTATTTSIQGLVALLARLDGRLADLEPTPALDPDEYVEFENRFRGPSEIVRARQSAYLEVFAGRRNVLDLGCGRGEFLEVLSAAGVPASGVDISPLMVEQGLSRGLRVERNDMFDHLRSLEPRAVDGIFTAQVVEHLTAGRVRALFDGAARVLPVGAPLVVETVNPHCASALAQFHLDPTHVAPLPPGLVAFLLECTGFRVDVLRYSAPVLADLADWVDLPLVDGRVQIPDNAPLYADYSLIAHRAPEDAGGPSCAS